MISQHHKSWIYSWAVQKAWTSDKKYKLALTEVKMRVDQRFTVVIYWKKKCKCVHWVRVVSLKTNDTGASPGFSAGGDNKPSVKCRRGIKTRCHRRHGRCWCGPSLSTARELFTGESPRLIMSTNRAPWTSRVGAARVERQTSLRTLRVKCRSAGWRSSLSVQGNFPCSECPCRCPFTVLLS